MQYDQLIMGLTHFIDHYMIDYYLQQPIQIMSILAFIIFSIGISILLGPLFFRYILLTLNIIHSITFTMIHPFNYGHTIITKLFKLSFLKGIVIFIHRVQFKVKKWKLVFRIQKLQLFLQLNNLNFEKLNQLKENYEAKCLNNIVTILPEIVEYYLTRLQINKNTNRSKHPLKPKNNNQDIKQDDKPNVKSQASPLKKSLIGLVTIGVMLLTQFIEISVANIEIDFTEDKSSSIDFLKLKALSILNLRFPEIKIQFSLTKSHQLEFKLSIPQLLIEQFSQEGRQMYRDILEIQKIQFLFKLPFNLNISKAIENSDIRLRIQSLKFIILPSDLENICDLIAGISFMNDIKQFCNTKSNFNYTKKSNKVSKEQQQERTSKFNSFTIQLPLIQIQIKQIYEKDTDTNESSQYLTSIKSTTLKSTNLFINISQHGNFKLTINEITLLISSIDSENKQMLSIKQFTFQNQIKGIFNSIKTIKHNDVVVETTPQSLAVLTKIFIIISRIKRQHYSLINYLQFLNYYLEEQQSLLFFVSDGEFQLYLVGLKKFIKNDLKPLRLLELHKKSLNKPVIMNNVDNTENNKQQFNTDDIQNRVVYSINQVSFNLTLREITHRLDFNGASYQRIMERNKVLNIVKVQKLTVALPTSNKKQFELSNAEVYIKESKLLTEVDMFIDQFVAIQNQMCLIQYLIGFPILEKCLQIQSSQKKNSKSNRSRQTYHIKKTSFSYEKIHLNFHELTFQVGKKTLSSNELNLSVVKIELLYKFDMKISKSRFMFVNTSSIKKDITLCKIANITLTSYESKSVIIIKNPQLFLPKQFIKMGKQYQKLQTTINNLGTYLEAYLLNISDQILRQIRKNIQQRYQAMANLEIRCYKLNVQVQQSQWNSFILNYNRIIREYLSLQLFYNEQEIINEIKRNKVKKPLLNLSIDELRMQTKPIKALQKTDQSIIGYIKNIGEVEYIPNQVLYYSYGVMNVSLSKLKLNLRDYPFDIVSLDQLGLEALQVYVHMRPSYYLDNCVYYYFTSKIQIGQLNVTGGLNISFALKQLSLRINKLIEGYVKSEEKTIEETIWLQEIKKLKSKKQKKIQINTNYIPLWEMFRQRIFFKLTVQKNKQTTFNLLTDIRPYALECITIKLGKIFLISDKEQILITFHGLGIYKQLFHEQFKLIDFGKINCKILLNWKPLLHLQFQVAMGEEYHNIIHLRTDLIQFLINLPQLRTDILRFYGIDIPKASTQLGDLSGKTVELSLIKWMNYGELIQLAFDSKLDNNKNTLSIWNIIQNVSFIMSIRELSLIMSTTPIQNQQNSSTNIDEAQSEGIQLIFGHFRIKLTCSPQVKPSSNNKLQWIIKGGSGKIQTTVGRIYEGQLLTLNQFQQHYQQKDLTSSRNVSYQKDLLSTFEISQSRMKYNFRQYPRYQKRRNNRYQPPKKKQQFFLQSNELFFIKNHMYKGDNDQQFIAKNFIQYNGLKLVLSGSLINIINKLSVIKYKKQIIIINRQETKIKRKQSSPARVSLFKDVQQDIIRKQVLMEKWRNAVRLIIGHHRQGSIKTLLEQIKLNVLFILRHPQINVFYEQKNCQMILRTPKSCQIQFRVNHLPYDSLELDPKYTMEFKFQQFELWSCTSFSTVKWLEKDMRNSKQMSLCLECPSAIFKMSLFKLQKCSIDFSLRVLNKQQDINSVDRTRIWGLEQRKKNIDIDLNSVIISLDRSQKLTLINIIQFFILITTSKKKRFIQETKIYQSKMNQMKIYGKAKILQRLVNKANKDILDKTSREQVCMKFRLSKILIRLINQNLKNSLISKCFMEIKAEQIILDLTQQTNNCTLVSLQTKQIQIINPLEQLKSKYRVILSMNHLGKTVFKLYLQTYSERLFDKNNIWNYHRLVSISINPIKLKFTDELYKELMQFVEYGIEDINKIPQTLVEKSNLSKFSQPEEIEEYYNKIIIEPVKVQLWYQSTSLLKRMDGISIELGKFLKSNKFCLKKDIATNLMKFVINQVLKQTFSVLGQKMFGGEEEDYSDQEEIVV